MNLRKLFIRCLLLTIAMLPYVVLAVEKSGS
ncbi:MAG: hypothetical protein HONBIEJF_01014 [Fimbriimonadaceae bacterium]|nr:hypothetical protein [Fimbriimonadaceae bacterium]